MSSGFRTSFPGAIGLLEVFDVSEGFVASGVSLAFDMKVAAGFCILLAWSVDFEAPSIPWA